MSANLPLLAECVKARRGTVGIRQAAVSAGVSPATLSRVENEKAPDLETFRKLCLWLDAAPSKFLGTPSKVSATTMSPGTGEALADQIMIAAKRSQEWP